MKPEMMPEDLELLARSLVPRSWSAARPDRPGCLPELDRPIGVRRFRPRRRASQRAHQLHRHLGVAKLWRHDPSAPVQERSGGQSPGVWRSAEGRHTDPGGLDQRGRIGCAARGGNSRGGCGPARLAAGGEVHLRQLRGRQAERVGPRCSPPGCGGRGGGWLGHLQPAFPLWWGRSRQDPPDACHRLGGEAEQSRRAHPLPFGGAVHVPLRLGAAVQGDARLQGDVPLGRHADGR